MIYRDYYIEELPQQCNIYSSYDAWRDSETPVHTVGSLEEARQWVDQYLGHGTPADTENVEEFIRKLPFMPEKGKPLPEYVYRGMRPEFVASVMFPPVSDYGRALLDKVALDVVLFMKGGNFTIVDRLEETGWSSDNIAYNGILRHGPTSTEWHVEVWQNFEWRNPSKPEETSIDLLAVREGPGEEWTSIPEESADEFSFDLSKLGGEEASRKVVEFRS